MLQKLLSRYQSVILYHPYRPRKQCKPRKKLPNMHNTSSLKKRHKDYWHSCFLRYLPGSTPHLTRVLSPPFVSSSTPSSSISSTPTVLQSRWLFSLLIELIPRNNLFSSFRLANPYLQLDNAASISKVAKSNPYLEKFSSNISSQATQSMSRPVYLCEQHRKQRIMIEVRISIIVVWMQAKIFRF